MIIEAKVSLFRISRCGFYGYRRDDHKFASIVNVLHDLKQWGSDKALRQTKTFEVQDGQDLHPVYLFNIESSTDNWLITTWNETASYENGVASVNGDSRVGRASVDLTDVGPGSIPGFPTYFFIIPSENIIASIRFEHAWTGQRGLREYLKSFLGQFSKYVVFELDENGQNSVLGYREQVEDVVGQPNPHFDTKEIRNPGKLDEMRLKWNRIRKITRKVSLQMDHQLDSALWQRLLQKVHLTRPTVAGQVVQLKYDVTSTLTLPELNRMIEDWQDNRNRTWDDYGVLYTGGPSTPSWFSQSLAMGKIDLDVSWRSDAEIDSASLLRALVANREGILNLKT